MYLENEDVMKIIYNLSKQVGPNYNSSTCMLIHETCNAECPASCSHEWAYFTRGPGYDHPELQRIFTTSSFVVDESINVSCGKNSIQLN